MTSLVRRAARLLPGSVRLGIHRAATAAHFLYNKGSVTTPDGQTFDVPQTTSPTDYFSLANGHYEQDEIETLRKFFEREDGTIIEIGSNIGVVARYAISEKLAPGGTYFCVEPNPAAHQALATNMARAAGACPGRDIRILKTAVHEPTQSGKGATFFARPNLGSGLAGLVKSCGREMTMRVPTTSLSEIVAQSPSPSISLICDAEGAEIPIITKDAAALSKIRQIAIELHEPSVTGSTITPRLMVESLKRLGFRHGGRINKTHYFSRSP